MGKGWQVEGVDWIRLSLVSRILILRNITQLLHGFVLLGFGGGMDGGTKMGKWSIWSLRLGKLPLREFLHATHIAEENCD